MVKTQFETTLLAFGNNTGIEVPLEHLQALGTSKKPAVRVQIGEYAYESTIASMNQKYLIPVSKAHREAMHIKAGDSLTVTLTLITGERVIEIPEVLLTMLKTHRLEDSFNSLSYSTRKEMIRKIVDAKKVETLEKRLQELIHTLTNN